MAVQTRGTVQFRGEGLPPVDVDIEASSDRLRLTAANRVIGDWEVGAIGIKALMEGFSIRAEGEELLIQTENDAAVAEALELRAASPRIARLMVAAHRPVERVRSEDTAPAGPGEIGLWAMVYGLAGLLVVIGGTFLRQSPAFEAAQRSIEAGLGAGGRFWLSFILVGVVMLVVASSLALRLRGGRVLALVASVGLIVLLGMAASTEKQPEVHLFAYGFIAAGLVAAVAVLSSSSLDGG